MFSFEETVLKGVAKKSGYPVSVGRATGNPLTGRLWVQDLEVENPVHYPSRDFLSLAEMKVHVSPTSLLGRRVRVKEMEVHVRSLTGIQAESGVVNIEEFRVALERREEEILREKKPGPREFDVKRLRVKVDQVATVDYTNGNVRRRDYPLRYVREFRDVVGWLAVARPLVEDFGGAGLTRGSDAIFATLLSDLLWSQIESGSR